MSASGCVNGPEVEGESYYSTPEAEGNPITPLSTNADAGIGSRDRIQTNRSFLSCMTRDPVTMLVVSQSLLVLLLVETLCYRGACRHLRSLI